MTESALLEVQNLTVDFATDRGSLRAVDDISFRLPPGKILCLVGESGCGKSVTAHAILRLLPGHSATVKAQSILFQGKNLVSLPDSEMQRLRGSGIAMIFQDPMTALNPVYTVGKQIAEVIWVHEGKTKLAEVKPRVVKLLSQVGIPDPSTRFDSYPHELSGGMRQRIMIAMALACGPKLLIGDEPTTALDVTIQAQILELVRELQRSLQMGVLLITHDLGVVAEMADEVAVMYSGRIVERGSREAIFKKPLHPYTQGLLASVPDLDAQHRRDKLASIPGQVPSPFLRPQGCRFQDRCFAVQPHCREREPVLEQKHDHWVACFEVK